MKTSRIIGIIFIFIGVGVFCVGFMLSPHVNTFATDAAGHYTGHMSRYLIAASVFGLVGFLMAMLNRTGKSV